MLQLPSLRLSVQPVVGLKAKSWSSVVCVLVFVCGSGWFDTRRYVLLEHCLCCEGFVYMATKALLISHPLQELHDRRSTE